MLHGRPATCTVITSITRPPTLIGFHQNTRYQRTPQKGILLFKQRFRLLVQETEHVHISLISCEAYTSPLPCAIRPKFAEECFEKGMFWF